MFDWIAIVAFCLGEQCGFWINSDKPYQSETECRKNLAQAEQYFKQNNAAGVMAACIPLKWVKV